MQIAGKSFLACVSCKTRTLLDCSSLANHVRHNHLGPEIWFDGERVRPEKMRELDVGDLKVCHSFFVWGGCASRHFCHNLSTPPPSNSCYRDWRHRQHVVKCCLHLLVAVRKGELMKKWLN